MDDDDYEPLDYFGTSPQGDTTATANQDVITDDEDYDDIVDLRAKIKPPTGGDARNSSPSRGDSIFPTPSLTAKNRADNTTTVSSNQHPQSEPHITCDNGKGMKHSAILHSRSEDIAEVLPPSLPPKKKDSHRPQSYMYVEFRDRITSVPAKSSTLGSHTQRKTSLPLPPYPNGTHGINDRISKVPPDYLRPKSTLVVPSVNDRSHSPVQSTSTFKPLDPVTKGITKSASQETIAPSRPTPPAPYNTLRHSPPTITTNTTTQDRNQPTYTNPEARLTTTVNLPLATPQPHARPTTTVNLPLATPQSHSHSAGSPLEQETKDAYVTMNPVSTSSPSLAGGSHCSILRTPHIQRRVTVDYSSVRNAPLDTWTIVPGQFTVQALRDQLGAVEESNTKLSEHATGLESDLQQSLEQLIDHQQWMENEIKVLVQQVDALQSQLMSSSGLQGNKSPSSFHAASPEPEWSRQRGPTDGECQTSGLHCSEELNKQYLASISSTQVLQLLELLGLQQYSPSFQQHEVDGEFLSECSENMLCNSLRVTSRLHRLRLLKIICGHHPVRQMLKS